MRQCVTIIEDYARLSPSSIGAGRQAIAQVQANLNGSEMNIDPALNEQEPEVKEKEPKAKKEKVKRVTKPKDPNAPKRPPSAYLIYQNAMREEIKAAHPEFSYSEILKEISARWAKISPEERAVSLITKKCTSGTDDRSMTLLTRMRMPNTWSRTRRTRIKCSTT